MRLPLLALSLCLASSWISALAEDLNPTLGTPGDPILVETFDGPDVPKGWFANTGTLRIVDGSLHAAEESADKHIGAFRYRLPLQDCAVQFDFRLGEARTLNFGYDPAPGQLDKKGHLFSLIITKSSWSITEHNNKADPASKPKVLAKAAVTFDPAKTYTVLIECKGDTVVAQATGQEPLRATSADFHVKKPGLVFRMGGKDKQEVIIDNVKVSPLQ